MADLNMVLKEAQKLNGSIRSLLRLSTYEDYDDLSGLSIDYEDGQQLFLQTELREIMEKLSDVTGRIAYLSRPVMEGRRVLLVDVDSQGSMTASLGYQQPDQIETTLATILGGIIMDEPLPPGSGILHHAEGVDLLPANIELSGMEVTLVNTMSRETILRQYLNTVRGEYDVMLYTFS